MIKSNEKLSDTILYIGRTIKLICKKNNNVYHNQHRLEIDLLVQSCVELVYTLNIQYIELPNNDEYKEYYYYFIKHIEQSSLKYSYDKYVRMCELVIYTNTSKYQHLKINIPPNYLNSTKPKIKTPKNCMRAIKLEDCIYTEYSEIYKPKKIYTKM